MSGPSQNLYTSESSEEWSVQGNLLPLHRPSLGTNKQVKKDKYHSKNDTYYFIHHRLNEVELLFVSKNLLT